MNKVYVISVILIVSIVTIIIRFAPFIIFKNKVPKVIEYLGKYLPYSIMAMLVVYCLKDVDVTRINSLVPSIVASFWVIGIHIYKKNILLSIVSGTVIYMVLLNVL